MIERRNGDWVQLHSGGKFYPLDPRPEEVNIYDIAWSLSNLCRYNGQGKFYSVAEHSILVSYLVPSDMALASLLHDASESFIGDCVRPLKKYFYEFCLVEDRIMACVAEKFGFAWPMPGIVKEIDNQIIANERAELFIAPHPDWEAGELLLGVKIECLTPNHAYKAFMDRYLELSRGIV